MTRWCEIDNFQITACHKLPTLIILNNNKEMQLIILPRNHKSVIVEDFAMLEKVTGLPQTVKKH